MYHDSLILINKDTRVQLACIDTNHLASMAICLHEGNVDQNEGRWTAAMARQGTERRKENRIALDG